MPDEAATAEHEDTPVGPVGMVMQVIVNQAFPEPPDCGVQDATGTFDALLVEQVVLVQLFPEFAEAFVQLETPVGPVVGVAQVVVV